MGIVQRIFYLHAPCGMVALAAFLVCFVGNLAYLFKRTPKWDWLGVSAAEVGLAFCTVVLLTGPIWAKPAWGVYWAWDARLTSTLVLWLLYLSWLSLTALMALLIRQRYELEQVRAEAQTLAQEAEAV